MKVILRKIFYFLPFVFIALAMIMMVHLGISLKNKEIPSVFNRAILYVITPSMEDTIMAGDLIFIDTNEEEFFEGDIISFRRPDQQELIITHRIDSIDQDTGLITTKGDNNFDSEDWEVDFSPDLIVGKYVGKSGMLGSVYEVLFVNSINLLFGLITIVFLLIGVIEFKNIIKLLSKKKEAELEEEKIKLIEEFKETLKEEMKDDE
ncbi:MAG TPA: signal peptidase I [Bacillota bacterium]|nr:signal peptidase I [Bacillota bacterium]